MTPLKDTLEVSHAGAESHAAPSVESPSKPDSGGLRSDAVSLDVPVKVHGSRVTEVVRGITPHSEPFEEQTSTMIVFPQGGVLRMSTPVTAGQMMVVTNLKSGHDAICRVVKVRAYAQSQSYVEIEFTNRQQGYWGVRFAGDNLDPAKTLAPMPPAPPAPAISTTVRVESRHSAEPLAAPVPPAPIGITPPAEAKRPAPPPVFSAPVKPPAPPAEHAAQASQKESSFVGIGSQEEVQPAATTTTFKTKSERTLAPAASLTMSELRGDTPVAAPISASMGSGVPGEMTDLLDELEETVAPKPQLAEPVPASAIFTPMPVANAAPQKVFGARFDAMAPVVSEAEGAESAPPKSTNWFFVATGIAAMLAVAVGGGLYFHLLPTAKSNARAESVAPAVASPATNPNAAASPAPASTVSTGAPNGSAQYSQQPAAAPSALANPPAPAPAVRVIEPASATGNRVQASAPANQKPAKAMPDMSGALNSHPVSAQRASSDDAEAAPSVDAGSSNSGELQQMASAADVAPPPAPVAPIKVGGDVHPPQLISSVMPIYPAMARSSGITGNVVVQASINAAGVVIGTKVISGPVVLRQAAVEALRRWKYHPAMLNGTPVPVDVTVTMSFHK
jgi:periplasmic protein TonB